MYKDHKCFEQPQNEEMKIWRYMSLPKFISILETQSLFFNRADRFDDPLEGTWPEANVIGRRFPPPNMSTAGKIVYITKSLPAFEYTCKELPKKIGINCWHANQQESKEMWENYIKDDEGIVIQSTYAKLKNSITDKRVIYLGVVKYIDHKNNHIEYGNLYGPYLYKGLKYSYENEIRAFYKNFGGGDNISDPKFNLNRGELIEVDLNNLIENIYIKYGSPVDFSTKVKEEIRKHGFYFNVSSSKLS